MSVDRDLIECWRATYCLDKTPHELHAMWQSWAPPGAVLALRAAVEEIERLLTDRAGLLRRVNELESRLEELQ